MPTFAYEISCQDGEQTCGTIEAASEQKARRMLAKAGNFVMRISEIGGSSTEKVTVVRSKGRVPRTDVIFVANQLAVMLDTGVPLSDALSGIARHTKHNILRSTLNEVSNDVQAGQPLSECLARFPKIFPKIMISLVKAGEVTGDMGTMFIRIADYLTKEYQITKQVKAGMAYPIFMFVMCLTVSVFMVSFVFPRFASIYAAKNADLPMPTEVLMYINYVIANNYIELVGGIVLTAGFLFLGSQTSRGRLCIDWLKLNLPIVGPITRSLYLTRSTRIIATLIDSGISLLDIMSSVRGIVTNRYYLDLWDKAEENLRGGMQLSDTFLESKLIPGPISQMVESGEKAGRLGVVFNRVADFTQAEFDEAVKSTIKFIEPVMIVFLGSVIGFIAIALLLPIFTVSSVISKS